MLARERSQILQIPGKKKIFLIITLMAGFLFVVGYLVSFLDSLLLGFLSCSFLSCLLLENGLFLE
jgi:hypothetical protein